MSFGDFRSKKKRSFLPYLPLALSFFFHVRAHGWTELREEKRIERALLLRAGAPPRQRHEPPAWLAKLGAELQKLEQSSLKHALNNSFWNPAWVGKEVRKKNSSSLFI